LLSLAITVVPAFASECEIKPSPEFERALAQCTPEDFDGHTEFHRLTPEQRLEWLCQAGDVCLRIQRKSAF